MIKEITVGIQRVINLGNYENVRYECSATATVDGDLSPQEVYAQTLTFCKENVLAEIDRIYAIKGKK